MEVLACARNVSLAFLSPNREGRGVVPLFFVSLSGLKEPHPSQHRALFSRARARVDIKTPHPSFNNNKNNILRV
jgi:hypothetical protein